MRYDDALGLTFAAIGATVMLLSAVSFLMRLTNATDAEWWILYGSLFCVGAVIMFAGLYLRPASYYHN